jgi:hypothetical protein
MTQFDIILILQLAKKAVTQIWAILCAICSIRNMIFTILLPWTRRKMERMQTHKEVAFSRKGNVLDIGKQD